MGLLTVPGFLGSARLPWRSREPHGLPLSPSPLPGFAVGPFLLCKLRHLSRPFPIAFRRITHGCVRSAPTTRRHRRMNVFLPLQIRPRNVNNHVESWHEDENAVAGSSASTVPQDPTNPPSAPRLTPLRLHAAHRDWSERLGDGARAGLQPLNALQNAACREPSRAIVPLAAYRGARAHGDPNRTLPVLPAPYPTRPTPNSRCVSISTREQTRLSDPKPALLGSSSGTGLGHSRCSGVESPPTALSVTAVANDGGSISTRRIGPSWDYRRSTRESFWLT